MPLDPSEVDALARAVASLAMWGTAAGLIFAVFCGILIALRITVPFGAREVERRMLDPEGVVQKARAKELENFKEEVRKDILPAVEGIFAKKLGDLDAQRQRVEGELSAVRADLAPLKKLGEDLQPLLLTVDGTIDGKPAKLSAIVAQLTELAVWTEKMELGPLGKLPSAESLEALPEKINAAVGSAVQGALDRDFAVEYERVKTEMRQESMRRHAAGMAEEFAGEAAFAIQNPEAAGQGLRVQKLEAAFDEWCEKHHYSKNMATAAKEFILPALQQRGVATGGGGGGSARAQGAQF
jgi:hypothetical protein